MHTTKPYFIRAVHEWCTDEGLTPYLAVSVDDTTRVPRESVKNGEIVLNVGNEATNQLQLGNEAITFQARFSGRVFPVMVPIERVSAIFARENGQGMAFEVGQSTGVGVPIAPLEASSPEMQSSEGAKQIEATDKRQEPAKVSHLTRIK
jgi:stringent starvation protein B